METIWQTALVRKIEVTDSSIAVQRDRKGVVTISVHHHDNQNILDTYAQSETNLADAVNKKHGNSLDHNGAIQDIALKDSRLLLFILGA